LAPAYRDGYYDHETTFRRFARAQDLPGTLPEPVRRGETIVVTDRSEPVAELRPLPDAGDPLQAALRKLAATGAVALPTRPAAAPFQPIRARGATGSGAIDRDREERG
jgi:antitoxin (DNA-binding transcriptional repressor) of toxin-antitoxin stability system